MRGTVAKRFRLWSEGNKKLYKDLKRSHVRIVALRYEPNLPKKTRWERSKLKFAQAPTGSGRHYEKRHPLRQLGRVFIDFNDYGKASALHIAKNAGKLSKPELESKIKRLINDERKFQSNES